MGGCGGMLPIHSVRSRLAQPLEISKWMAPSAEPVLGILRTSEGRDGSDLMVRPFQVLLTAGALLLGSIPATGPVAMNRPGNRESADTLTVSSRVQCGRCRVTLARVADLARGEGYDVDVPSFSVVRTDNGRFFATGYGEPRTHYGLWC